MKVLRFIGNLLLALALIAVIGLIMLTVGGVALSRAWEDQGLEYGALEQGRWLWIDDEPLHYLEWGADNDAPIVLIHGLEVAGSATWLANGRDLSRRGHRVVAIDLRGLGHSARGGPPELYTAEAQALLVAQALNQLRIQNATVVGHGWGGDIALHLAQEQPQFVGRLVLIAPYAGAGEGDSRYMRLWRAACRWPYTGHAASWLMFSGGPIGRHARRQAIVDRSLGSEVTVPEGYWSTAARPTHIVGTTDSLVAIAAAWENDEARLRSAAPRISAPVTLIVGEGMMPEAAPTSEDPSPFEFALTMLRPAPPEDVQGLADALGAELVVLPGAGHYPQLQQPGAINRLLSDLAHDGS
jgi:pimeloyl-ACP methyl ester carboxylesterase